MKLVIAYIRTECAAHVMRELHETGVGGITCYRVAWNARRNVDVPLFKASI
jgi:hypothetical protein